MHVIPRRVHARMRVPLSLVGALRAALDAVVPMRDATRRNHVAWAFPYPTVVTLSVRSAFAALIEALDLRPGDEIAMSGVTIDDMALLPEAYGLTVVPIPLDPVSLQPSARALAEAITPRTRVFVAAQLFGGRTSLTQCTTVAHSHGLLVVCDAAQALGSEPPGESPWHVDPDADVTFLSFGALKTATALGGGVAVCRNGELARRIDAVQARWARRSRWIHLQRSLRYGVLSWAARPSPFAWVLRALRARGHDPDVVLIKLTKGFGTMATAQDLRDAIRQRPDAGLETTLARRVRRARLDRAVRQRRAIGHAITRHLGTRVPGNQRDAHGWWLVPVHCPDPGIRARLRATLLANGFDATPIETTNLVDLGLRAGGAAAAPSLRFALLLPSLYGMSRHEARRMTDIVRATITPPTQHALPRTRTRPLRRSRVGDPPRRLSGAAVEFARHIQ